MFKNDVIIKLILRWVFVHVIILVKCLVTWLFEKKSQLILSKTIVMCMLYFLRINQQCIVYMFGQPAMHEFLGNRIS